MAETWQYSRREKQLRHSQNRIRSSWRDWSRRTSYGNGRILYFRSEHSALSLLCGEQRRARLGAREILGIIAGNLRKSRMKFGLGFSRGCRLAHDLNC